MNDRRGLATALGSLGTLAHLHGEAAQAEALYAESLARFRDLGDQRHSALVVELLSELTHSLGEQAHAAEYAAQSHALVCDLPQPTEAARAVVKHMVPPRGDGEIGSTSTRPASASERGAVVQSVRQLTDGV